MAINNELAAAKPGRRNRHVGKRLSPEKTQQREDQAYKMRLLGKTPEEIAEEFGLSASRIRAYLHASKERQIDELRKLEGSAGVVHQFAVLKHVLEESLAAWHKSKEIKKIKTAGVETKDINIGDGNMRGLETKKRSGQREEDQIGDAMFLDRAMRASKEIRDLLGLDAPEVKRLLVADVKVEGLTIDDYEAIPTDELLQRYRAQIGLGYKMVE